MFSSAEQSHLRVTVESFGYKYGTPTDVDIMADARFLPNPFWEPELGAHTGRDKAVSDFVMSSPGATEFLEAYTHALVPVWAGFLRENKKRVTLAIGCTGGKHRSVALVESLATMLREVPGLDVSVKHRDLGRE
jgi:UPF0042 nucleotide-binding protein